jgi:hypothetical protein
MNVAEQRQQVASSYKLHKSVNEDDILQPTGQNLKTSANRRGSIFLAFHKHHYLWNAKQRFLLAYIYRQLTCDCFQCRLEIHFGWEQHIISFSKSTQHPGKRVTVHIK